jgi:hypothetical protein
MVKYPSKFLLSCLFTLIFIANANAAVEWNVNNTFGDGKPIIDVVISSNGRVYVLTGDGEVVIYEKDGQIKDKITVGRNFDKIRAGAKDEQLFLTDSLKGTIQEISLLFIHDFDLIGAPFLGLKEAPISIVVFIDYQ